MPLYTDPMQMYGRMNNSVERANRFADERKQRGWDFEDQMRQLQLSQGQQDLTEGRRRFDLGREDTNRRFGDQLAIFRQIFSAPNPQVPRNAMMLPPRGDYAGEDGGQNALLRWLGRY